jgi:hypothetical protein
MKIVTLDTHAEMHLGAHVILIDLDAVEFVQKYKGWTWHPTQHAFTKQEGVKMSLFKLLQYFYWPMLRHQPRRSANCDVKDYRRKFLL